jgi:hypothetical protein
VRFRRTPPHIATAVLLVTASWNDNRIRASDAGTIKAAPALTASSERRAKVTITVPPILARHFFACNLRRLALQCACRPPSLSNQYEAACTGIGVAGLPAFIGDADARLVRLPASHAMLTLDIWIAMHPDRRRDPHGRNTAARISELIASAGLGLENL